MTFKLDNERLILSFNREVEDVAGNRNAVLAHIAKRLTKLGLPTQPATIQKWIERDMLPGNRLVHLAILARRDGRDLNLVDYLTTETVHTRKA